MKSHHIHIHAVVKEWDADYGMKIVYRREEPECDRDHHRSLAMPPQPYAHRGNRWVLLGVSTSCPCTSYTDFDFRFFVIIWLVASWIRRWNRWVLLGASTSCPCILLMHTQASWNFVRVRESERTYKRRRNVYIYEYIGTRNWSALFTAAFYILFAFTGQN